MDQKKIFNFNQITNNTIKDSKNEQGIRTNVEDQIILMLILIDDYGAPTIIVFCIFGVSFVAIFTLKTKAINWCELHHKTHNGVEKTTKCAVLVQNVK